MLPFKECKKHGVLENKDKYFHKKKYICCRLCKREEGIRSYFKNHEKRRLMAKNCREKNKEQIKQYQDQRRLKLKNGPQEFFEEYLENNRKYSKKYYESNKDKILEKSKKYREQNIDKARERYRKNALEINKKRYKKDIENLSDRYIKKTLIGKGSLRSKDIPDWLITLKREQLRLKNEIKLMENDK